MVLFNLSKTEANYGEQERITVATASERSYDNVK